MKRWQEIKNKEMTPERVAELDRQVREELEAMTLCDRGEGSGETQAEVAKREKTTNNLQR